MALTTDAPLLPPATTPGRRAAELLARVPWAVRVAVVPWLLSRIAAFLGLAMGWTSVPGKDWGEFSTWWDSFWYVDIARHGYPPRLGAMGVDAFHAYYSQWAFFPGYPIVIRAVHDVTGLGYVTSAYLANVGLGFLAVVAFAGLAGAVIGRAAAPVATLLFASWCGTSVWQMAYSEPLFLAAAGGCLWMLARRRWWLAGLCGLVATATRPFGVALVAAAAVAAVVAIWRRREWTALAAPVLSAVGMAGFMLYGWHVTGDAMIWRHAENLWQQKLDFSAGFPAEFDLGLVQHGDDGMFIFLWLVCAALVVWAMAVYAVRFARGSRVVPLHHVVYVVAGLCLMLAYTEVGLRPRFVSTLLPVFLVVAAGAGEDDRKRRRLEAAAYVSVGLLCAVTGFYAGHAAIAP